MGVVFSVSASQPPVDNNVAVTFSTEYAVVSRSNPHLSVPRRSILFSAKLLDPSELPESMRQCFVPIGHVKMFCSLLHRVAI